MKLNTYNILKLINEKYSILVISNKFNVDLAEKDKKYYELNSLISYCVENGFIIKKRVSVNNTQLKFESPLQHCELLITPKGLEYIKQERTNRIRFLVPLIISLIALIKTFI